MEKFYMQDLQEKQNKKQSKIKKGLQKQVNFSVALSFVVAAFALFSIASFGIINGQKDTMTYILFDKDYGFKSIPEGFTLTDTHSIESFTDIVNEGKLKDRSVVEKELDKKANNLYIWVENLPVNNERND